MTQNYLCDTTILIDFFFGSSKVKLKIEEKTKDSSKHITYIIFGEFIRTIYKTIQKLLNKILENENSLKGFHNINDFILDVVKDIHIFSGQEGNRIIKLIPFLRDHIESRILKYKRLKLPLKLPIESIINDLNSYKNAIKKNFSLLKTSYRCLDFKRRLFFQTTENVVKFNSPSCPNCKQGVHNSFLTHYRSELIKFLNDFDNLAKKFYVSEKSKLTKSLQFINNYKPGDKIDGGKHYCWRLCDLYIVLELPSNFILLTTNYRHQKPFTNCVNKFCERI